MNYYWITYYFSFFFGVWDWDPSIFFIPRKSELPLYIIGYWKVHESWTVVLRFEEVVCWSILPILVEVGIKVLESWRYFCKVQGVWLAEFVDRWDKVEVRFGWISWIHKSSIEVCKKPETLVLLAVAATSNFDSHSLKLVFLSSCFKGLFTFVVIEIFCKVCGKSEFLFQVRVAL